MKRIDVRLECPQCKKHGKTSAMRLRGCSTIATEVLRRRCIGCQTLWQIVLRPVSQISIGFVFIVDWAVAAYELESEVGVALTSEDSIRFDDDDKD